MRLIVGILTVNICVLGGYAAMGGKLGVLWQPWEFVIILGAAIGAFIIGNTGPVLKGSMGVIGTLMKGPRYNKAAYIELLGLQFSLFKLVQSKGLLSLESHIEDPHNSPIFTRFPTFAKDHHAVEFMCDYLRMVTLGTNVVHEMETLMDQELETHHQEQERLVGAVQALADGTPALGIVAAVLGIIRTMGAIDQEPAILGAMIGAALLGTFLGVFLAYGLVGPIAARYAQIVEEEAGFLDAIRGVIRSFGEGHAPALALELARTALPPRLQPEPAASTPVKLHRAA